MTPLRSTLVLTANKWIDAHLIPDMAAIAALRTPDTVYTELPKSLNIPVRNNEGWDAWHPTTLKLFTKYEMKIEQTFVDEEQRKVVMYVRAQGVSTGGVDYDNNYIFILTMTDDGLLIKDHWAFIDSLTMMEFIKKIGFSTSANAAQENNSQ